MATFAFVQDMKTSIASAGHGDRWQAVLSRDHKVDGRFVYAVSSTGVFCRPSCPSRKPKREHVAFFASPQGAVRAGYRACLRCRPQSAAGAPSVRRIAQACAYLDARAGEAVTLAQLGAAVGLSPYHLQRSFKQSTGMTPREYAAALRMQRLRGELRSGGSVTAAIYEAGYGSSSSAYEQSRANLGMTPGAFRSGAAGTTVRFDIAPCALGRLLVAGTDRGVCAVMFDDEDGPLEASLRAEFPGATIERDRSGLASWTEAIQRYLRGGASSVDLPLDVRATVFQRRVWRALQRIPYGTTRSYRELAAAIGRPNAARAVGAACARNPVSVLVPCHRAVRSDGNLAGYRWGLGRKQQLQEIERAHGGKAAR